MNKVLITGVTGFAGSFLAEYLAKNSDSLLFGTYNTQKSLENVASIKDKISLTSIDLTDAQAVDDLVQKVQPNYIYHLAALPSPAESFQNPHLYFHNNVDIQLHLFESLLKHNLLKSKVLIVSSAEVYGMITDDDLPIDEKTPFRPVSPYGVSKVAQDLLGYQYYIARKLNIIRVRPFNHIGPRLSDKFAASAFAKKIAEIEAGKREKVLTVGNLKARRDMTDVRDMVRAYYLAMEKGETGDVYNIGRGESFLIEDILNMLVSLSTEKNIQVKTDASLLRPNDIPNFVCDNSKFRKQTGWEITISLEDSLKDTLDYWRSII